MSVQFGRWNFDGKPVDRDYLEKARATIAPYGPDDAGSYLKGNISILYHAFHTTKESRRETQPHITATGAVITWDGRLDNRAELIRQLKDVLTIGSTDVSIVAAAYEEWGTNCLGKLIGDWALSIWGPDERSLILAKDPIGTRHLYYSFDKEQVSWCTILNPLVLFTGKTFKLEEEYIAGWLSFFPATQLTPYVGIHSVSPSCFVLVEPGRQTISKYWDFDPSHRIRYRTDGEYEEHFRQVLAESVRRRLRSDSPIFAELSGGMDSSSIVCMADMLAHRGLSECPRLDTLSYYDDSEPNWNERPFFSRVEEKRGRVGCHIDVGSQPSLLPEFCGSYFAVTPAAGRRPNQMEVDIRACMASQGNRVLLSGTGGDEVLGGVPIPVPELADLLVTASFCVFGRQLLAWALAKRKSVWHLLTETISAFFPVKVARLAEHKRPAAWLNRDFVIRNRDALRGYETRLKWFGPLPSFQKNLATLDALRRQLTCSVLDSKTLYEMRYPHLDRNLLEFLIAIPQEQLLRPGQRRSLMRRSLRGIVPDEILDRRRKAFVARAPMVAVSADWSALAELSRDIGSNAAGIIDPTRFREALEKARCGGEVPIVALMRTVILAAWLKHLRVCGIRIRIEGNGPGSQRSSLRTTISAEKN